MNLQTATVSTEYLRVIATSAEARGLDIGPIFTACGIDRTILRRRGARIGATAIVDTWRRCTERLGDPHFGLTVVETLPLAALTQIDFLLLSSATVRDGLNAVARYAPLMGNAERLELIVQGTEARFRLHNGNGIPYPVEMIMGLFAQRARDLFAPSWSVKRFCFSHAPLGPRATYDRILQAPVEFETRFTEAVFARDLMAAPMPGANPHLNELLAADADAVLAAMESRPRSPSFMDTVKRTLEEGFDERDLTLTGLADHLGISTRTLQRRLRAVGVTHRSLVRSVRQELAARSLATGASQRQIARTLGYSGAAAFQRAFKRWSGTTPGQLRRRGRR